MAILKYLNYSYSLIAKGSPFFLANEISKDFLGIKNRTEKNNIHIKSAVEWILNAQKANNDGGVSEMYSLYRGWHGSYSETTGYIIPTMYNYYNLAKNPKIKESAVRMAEWELTKQLDCGAFPGGATADGKEFPIVFNTGQVLFGMLRSFLETKEEKYRESAKAAADWLVKMQNSKGYWQKSEYLETIHTYNTRTAWALLKAYEITGNKNYAKAASKNIDWALKQQNSNGWFENNAFHKNKEPLLHTIAYTIQGILECGISLQNEKYVNSAKSASDKIIGLMKEDGSIVGSFDSKWKSSVSWSCLTGNCQMSIVWLRLYYMTKDKTYLEAAKKSNNFVKSTQNINSSHDGIRGGIKGAYPIYGWYAPFCYINWGAKFFIDALMLEEDKKIGNSLS
ncbi:MAG TPA: glycoside hydrolase family 88 protein [Candidatus Nanoarchaeia archaeon]|nr:glycoside hydrolase family 88 protein [Candidatus Nanoarchaeia archaeon]